MDKSREQFEAAIKQKYGDLIDQRVCKNGDGEYMVWDMQVAWWAWQESRAAIEIDLPKTIEVHPLGPSTAKMFCELHKNTVTECANSIRAAGLKVKGE
ncbi:hypothetical protein MJ717_000453 [Cronobacter sakazakii]|uniref:hypothetical protein n=1 Tax=Cronobacter sakazakii TaxID=28141 RepID=UPI002A2EB308|nr:hypothetical protein [Cronobacter sakazakii]EIX1502333.1 hypothetical protein [Cronobacter sakazakii]EIX1525352.1 hypothetical protein [Cronobacter sakazakii]EIX1533353.1 hypothetical protein [Cronobacter sakazakii]EIX1621184.1 hypothetical protein [Cronobacter sakazakii]EIX1662406.1 hypothetical protein [Cronobacter sakazakii]